MIANPSIQHPPEKLTYLNLLHRATETLRSEAQRPLDQNGNPGGLVILHPDRDCLIVPDLHARLGFIPALLENQNLLGEKVASLLQRDLVQIVFVGDGFHSEGRGRKRWVKAREEYLDDFTVREHIDAEMAESLGTMERVMQLKAQFPEGVHFLKGNHENVTNELGNGNFPFCKYSLESQITTAYLDQFYGTEFIEAYNAFEKALPLMALGRHFLISHAQPRRHFRMAEVINARHLPEVIQGLTWTRNGESEQGAVERMLAEYLNVPEGHFFAGHRSVKGLYRSRCRGRFIQFHNPDKFIVCRLTREGPFSPGTDILEIFPPESSCETRF